MKTRIFAACLLLLAWFETRQIVGWAAMKEQHLRDQYFLGWLESLERRNQPRRDADYK